MLENYSKECKLFYFTKSITISIICLFSFVNAHHGKDYFVTTSYDTPHKGELIAILSIDNVNGDSHHKETENHSASENNNFSLEPGFLYGLSDNWTIELHSHNIMADGVLNTASIALESLVRIIDEKNDHNQSTRLKLPFSLAMLFEFGIGLDETPNDLELRLIVGRDLHLFSFVVNLIAQNTLNDNEHVQYKLALGVNPHLSGNIGGTLEFDMGLDEDSKMNITPGINYSPLKNFDFRLGTSIGLNADNTSLNIRSMIIYKF